MLESLHPADNLYCFLRLDEALVPYLGAAQELTEVEQQDMEIPLPVRKCPNCGRDMVLKKKREGNRWEVISALNTIKIYVYFYVFL